MRKTMVKKQIQRNAYANKHALQETFKENDEVFIKVHKPNTPKSITPKFTADKNGDPFVVTKVKGAYVLLFDAAKISSYYEHCSNVRKFSNKQTSPDALYFLRKGIFVPENKEDYKNHFFGTQKRGCRTPEIKKLFFFNQVPKTVVSSSQNK